MNYGKFKKPPPPGSTPPPGQAVTGKLRVVSYLWATTVPGNPFGTDGPVAAAPAVWPGDDLNECRQWQGVDLTAIFRPDGSVDKESISLRELTCSGVTESCGFLGKPTVTDRHVTEPKIVSSAGGSYVEVKTLFGTRLGAFIPDIDVGIPSLHADLGSVISQHMLEEFIEQTSEERYLGTYLTAPKIYTYAWLRLYADKVTGGWTAGGRGSGFLLQPWIISEQVGSSWMPEHHIYLNGALKPTLSLVPASADHWTEVQKWIDSPLPADDFAFVALSDALRDWVAETPLKEKRRAAEAFKKQYPDYFVGTDFRD